MSDPIQAHASVHHIGFTPIPTHLLQQPPFSMEAGFLLFHLLSAKQGWKFYDTKLCELFNIGREKLQRLFRELKETGYYRSIPITKLDGTFSGRRREFARDPIFLNPCEPNKIKASTESLKNRLSANPALFNNTRSVNNTNTNTDLNLKNNNNSNTREDIVVSEMNDCDKKLVSELINIGFKEKDALKQMRSYSSDKIKEKISFMPKGEKTAHTPPGWLIWALETDYFPEKIKLVLSPIPAGQSMVMPKNIPDTPETIAVKKRMTELAKTG
jgi:hypothetical protein